MQSEKEKKRRVTGFKKYISLRQCSASDLCHHDSNGRLFFIVVAPSLSGANWSCLLQHDDTKGDQTFVRREHTLSTVGAACMCAHSLRNGVRALPVCVVGSGGTASVTTKKRSRRHRHTSIPYRIKYICCQNTPTFSATPPL